MGLYQYRGKSRDGKIKKGKIKADNKSEALQSVREEGIAVTDLKELNQILYMDVQIGKQIKSQDFVIYLRQFSTLIKAGISVVESTKILAQQSDNKVMREVLQNVLRELQAGNPFSEAAETQKKVFPDLFVNMLKAGEAGGNLDEILDRLATYYEKQYETKRKIASAMAYPLMVTFVAIGAVIFLLTTVVPMFASMFSSFGAELPWITRAVMSASSWMGKYWWVILASIPLIFGVFQFIRRSEGKYYIDLILLKIPIFGKLFQKAGLARMTRTLSSLFSSSVPIIEALIIVERVVGNEVIGNVIQKSRNSLQQGESITVPMETHWVFPPLVTQMIKVGEKTGSLDTMLEKVADFYESEVENLSDQLKSLIEPLMIVMLALIVGVIVIAIAMPMFDIFNQIQ